MANKEFWKVIRMENRLLQSLNALRNHPLVPEELKHLISTEVTTHFAFKEELIRGYLRTQGK